MSAQPATQTLLLFCPYDRRVTRHLRRGADQALVCADCGRRADPPRGADDPDSLLLQKTSAIPVVVPRARSRVRRLRGSRARASWAPFVVVLTIVGVGIYAAATFAGSAITSPRASESTGAVGAVGSTSDSSSVAATSPNSTGATTSALRIAYTDGLGAYLRRTPSLNDRLRAWPDNTVLKVIGPDATSEGLAWKQVEDPAGNRGWIPARYTRPDDGT